MMVVWQREAVRNGRQFLSHVVPAVLKPARAIWNQFIGFIFMVFSVIFGFKTARLAMEFTKADQQEAGGALMRLGVAGFCTAVMLYFGLGSLLRARKISRS